MAPRAPPSLFKGAGIRWIWHSALPCKGAREGECVFPKLWVRWAEYRAAPSFPPDGACSSGWGTQKSPVPSHESWNMSVYPAVPILPNQVKLAQTVSTQEPSFLFPRSLIRRAFYPEFYLYLPRELALEGASPGSTTGSGDQCTQSFGTPTKTSDFRTSGCKMSGLQNTRFTKW